MSTANTTNPYPEVNALAFNLSSDESSVHFSLRDLPTALIMVQDYHCLLECINDIEAELKSHIHSH